MMKMLSKKRILFALIFLTCTIISMAYFLSFNYNSVSVCALESSMKTNSQLFENKSDSSTNQTTIITAYFHFDNSKHSSNEYNSWIDNFLPHIETPMVVFTDTKSARFIKNVRNGKSIHLLIYDNVWDMPSPIASLKHRYENEQHELDPEKKIHSPDLYAIWNSKEWMVNYTAQLNPFNSTYFYWVDIGAFRSKGMRRRRWPDINLVNEIFRTGTVHKLHVFAICKLFFDKNENEISYSDLSKVNFIVGGFFGGTAEAVRWWSKIFYETHNVMMDTYGLFVGKDQTLMNYIILQHQHRSKFFVTYYEPSTTTERIKDCNDEWFYFINWYSTEFERTPCCPTYPLYDMNDFSNVFVNRSHSL